MDSTFPRRRPRAAARSTIAAAAVAAMAGGAFVTAPGSAGATSADPATLTDGKGGNHDQVTLVTGDIVHWREVGGRPSVTVEDKGAHSTFQTIESGDDYYVIPSDVEPLVGTYLDRELFNVADLVSQGYTDAAVDGTPVIMASTGNPPSARSLQGVPGLTVDRALTSISSVAGTITTDDAKDFGKALASSVDSTSAARASKGTFRAAKLPGVNKIWLDRKVKASLEDSVPQTGAPKAWEAGYNGKGTMIAVLDTGIDTTHPDVADSVVASKNFSSDESIEDGHGHGTHVASTAAGTGAASDGLRKGVAPGADLAIGKVLDSAGSGNTSDVIAGMEWAASLDGVDVINMSLGGEVSDGTDPTSMAVNTLTEEHGVLFVTSAGNEGPRRGTASSPATAEAALAVGAVDKQGALAPFSSRGPRPGDSAVVPHVTAPGVGIKAARAKGTAMGAPVDARYTSANGTSMASPHVAGAVAILKQQHPDWDPQRLKSAMISSATPTTTTNTVFEQGGGEIDLAKAIEATVVPTVGALNMGFFVFPHVGADKVTKTLGYTNDGKEPVSLELSSSVKDAQGHPTPQGLVTISPSTVDIAPGATAQVDVILDRSIGSPSLYGGEITAKAADGTRIAGTPMSFELEEEIYDLTIKGIERDGTPAGDSSSVTVLDAVKLGDFGKIGVPFSDGVATVKVPRGTYSAMGNIFTEGPDGKAKDQTMLGDPEIEITKDTTLTLDARDAHEVKVKTRESNTSLVSTGLQYHRKSAQSGAFTHAWEGGTVPLYAASTQPVSGGVFNFGTKFVISSPEAHLDLAFPEFGSIPDNTTYVVNKKTTARVDSRYHSDVPERYSRAVAKRFPWESAGYGEYFSFDAPTRRTQVYSANETRMYQAVSRKASEQLLYEDEVAYKPGATTKESWFAAPMAPTLNEGNRYTTPDYPTARTGDELDLNIFEFGDSNHGQEGHYGGAASDSGDDTTAFRMYQNGELYAEGERGFGSIPVKPSSRLRFELDVQRDAPTWKTSTKTRTVWEFDSSTTKKETPLPMLQVGYDLPIDMTNRALRPRDVAGEFKIGLDVSPQRGVARSKITKVRAWMSFDDGKTWTKRKVTANRSGGFDVSAKNRKGPGAASIKVQATDADGSTVTQEVVRAYTLRP